MTISASIAGYLSTATAKNKPLAPVNPITTSEIDVIEKSISTAISNGLNYATSGGTSTMTNVLGPGKSTTTGNVSIILPKVATASAVDTVGYITFVSKHHLLTGASILLSAWFSPNWNGTYVVKRISDTEVSINFSELAPTETTTIGSVIAVPATASSAENTGYVGTVNFTSNPYLAVGAQIELSNWSPSAWNGSYSITKSTSSSVDISFLETAQNYYSVWMGKSDAYLSSQMNGVINNFVKAGYKISRIVNPATGSTFLWHITW